MRGELGFMLVPGVPSNPPTVCGEWKEKGETEGVDEGGGRRRRRGEDERKGMREMRGEEVGKGV